MRFAMCNEFCEGWAVEDVFRLAADVGYGAVEIAPFTLAPSVRNVSAAERRRVRHAAERAGVQICGLHWLLASPEGLHINHPDTAVRRKTQEYFVDLIHFCADLGGRVMTLGSPKQRSVVENDTHGDAWKRTVEFLQNVVDVAAERDVVIGLEPLARRETNFLNTKDEVVRMVREVDHPNLRMTLDCKAMSDEGRPVADILREGRPWLAHCHANDDNGRYPGAGSLDFAAILRALVETDYEGWVSLEVFDFSPDPETIAREGLAHLKRCLEQR